MSLFNKIKSTLEEGYKKDYLFKVIEFRYILIIKWYLLFIKKNDKDYLWADFRKKMDLDYIDMLKKISYTQKISSCLSFSKSSPC